jgi:hypothetical protein
LRTAAAARDPYSFVIFDDAPAGVVGIAAAIKGDPGLSETIIIALDPVSTGSAFGSNGVDRMVPTEPI